MKITNLHSLADLQSDAYQATGCYNLLCSGFVQTNSKIAIGAAISPTSSYNGGQFDISLLIWKVSLTWLKKLKPLFMICLCNDRFDTVPIHDTYMTFLIQRIGRPFVNYTLNIELAVKHYLLIQKSTINPKVLELLDSNLVVFNP